ncbi:MAG: hypothetical protein CML50_10005 [Rhodobacteraceae bacterium]|jgi:hypothetical protein|uniref:Arginine transporter n=1 Tax=Salipiger profundus TaxID=1229727 RepID=A0A1U7DC48_9RHOB|nr:MULTISPECIES: hypothetical protein [Salipiger]APX25646.1 hypothetical protein Ga0080559_TMP4850 [Salipiger profundus]MAB06328.1 hypothetical protein [Paracoccaceae bacterium]SFD54158.1 hypothetical protein SAMN05444415_11235 [Salipiger profundus]
MRTISMVMVLAVVAGCGGGGADDYRVSRMASGPISKACISSDRKARNPRLCGCIQAAANIELSGSDQRKAVRFYRDPHRAQEVRQSDRSSDRAFWDRYNDFIDRAENMCTGL